MAKSRAQLDPFSKAIANFLLAVKAIVLSPREFFDQMNDDDGGWLEPFLFFLCCAGVYSLMSNWIGLSMVEGIVSSSPELLKYYQSLQTPLWFSTWFLGLLIIMIASSFAMSFATTVVLNFLGGKGDFLATYRVMACCWVILLVSWIPLIGLGLGLYFFVLAWIGLGKAHDIPGWKGVVGVMGGSLSTFVVTFLICLLWGGFASTMHYEAPTVGDRWNNLPGELVERYKSHE